AASSSEPCVARPPRGIRSNPFSRSPKPGGVMNSVRSLARDARVWPVVAALLAAMLVAPTGTVVARSLPGGEKPELIQPNQDATLSETGLTFAWRAGPGPSA